MPGNAFNAPDAFTSLVKGTFKNFYLPHCGPEGVTGVEGYDRLEYPDIYPGISMHMYCGSMGQKIAFVIEPGASPDDLQLLFSGQDQMELDLWGNLKLLIGNKWIVLREAVAYQYDQNNTIYPLNWAASYVPNNNTGVVGFTFDSYDSTKPLVLLIGPPGAGGDPAQTPGVCWSAYLGGDGEDQIYASDFDNFGSYFVTGRTYSQNINFPVISGTVTTTASPKVFLTKFGTQDNLEWSCLYGCSSGDQLAFGLTVKIGGGVSTVFIGGRVNGSDLPQFIPPGSWTDYSGGAASGFLAEFKGNDGALMWSTYFGHYGSTVQNMDIDGQGRLAITGYNSGDLPGNTVTPPPNAEGWGFSGESDAFVALITPGRQILWSTYFGSSASDVGYSVRCAPNKIVVSGRVGANGLQTLDGGANAHDMVTGSSDSFIMEFDLNGVQQWGTYTGYALRVGLQGLAVNTATGDVYIVGFTDANLLPVTTTAPWYDASNSLYTDGFILQFSGTDRSINYATYVSGTGSTELTCVVAQTDGEFIVGGITWDPNMDTQPLAGLYSAPDLMGSGDGWIMAFTAGHWRSWSTYFGGEETDVHADCVRTLALKYATRVYAAGYTYAAYDQGEFFPLHDEGGGAWPDQALDPACDAFVAAFCTGGVLTSTSDVANAPAEFTLVQTAPGHWQCSGLSPGSHTYTITDVLGRIVCTDRLLGSSGLIDATMLTDGQYWFTVDEGLTKAVSVIR